MKRITKKVEREIIDRVKKDQPMVYWESSDFDRSAVEVILKNGIDDYVSELYDYNIGYISDLEHGLVAEIQGDYEEYDPDEIEEIVLAHVCVDINVKGLLSCLPEIACLLVVHSNYDCCNSFDEMEPESYIYEVYKRIKTGVKKSDYMHEFYNGAYGGCLLCFGFNTDIETFLKLRDGINTGKTVTIPEGTRFGFFSSFQGSGSVFEKTTYRKMTIPIKETGGDYFPQYDRLALIADMEQHYSVYDVYGQNIFKDGNITINQ